MISIPKSPSYRNPRLLSLAKECPRCMSCGNFNAGDVVAAHSNSQRHGKGMATKAHDLTCFVCFACHSLIDGRTGGLSRDTRERMFLEAFYNTQLWLFQEGLLKVVA